MLLETRKAIVEETEKLEKLIVAECFVADGLNVNDDAIKAMVSVQRLMSLCNRNMVEEAELLEQIDSKLDKLLSRKRES